MSTADHPDSIEQWRQRIRQETFANYHYQMGVAMVSANEDAPAEAAFHRALSIKPCYPECALELSLLLQRTNRSADVAVLERRMHDQNENWQAFGWCGHAEVLQQQGDLKAAADAWREALRRGSEKGYWGLLICLLRLGETAEADSLLKEAPLLPGETAEDMATQLFLLGNQLLQAEKWNNASLALAGCLRLNPGHIQAPASLGIAEQFCGRHAEAVAFLRQAVERQPGTGWIDSHLGLALQSIGHLDEAEQAHRTAQAAVPDNDAYAVNLSLIALARQDIAGAEAIVRDALAKHPLSSPAETHFAVLLYTKGQVMDAAQAWRRALKLNARYAQTAAPLRPWLASVFAELDRMVTHPPTGTPPVS